MKNTDKNDFNATIGNTVLCDGLLSMTDFVLEQLNKENSRTRPIRSVLNALEGYANFLKQPLKLKMFVPCDEDGNVLENPDKHQQKYKDRLGDFYLEKYKDDYKNYKQAKEKVLFEGFEQYEDYDCAKYKDVYIDEEVCDGKFTIEELIKDVGKSKIKLSQTALDSIFGETVA